MFFSPREEMRKVMFLYLSVDLYSCLYLYIYVHVCFHVSSLLNQNISLLDLKSWKGKDIYSSVANNFCRENAELIFFFFL